MKDGFGNLYGHFEYVLMPFDVANALISSQHMANDIVWNFLEIFTIFYMAGILNMYPWMLHYKFVFLDIQMCCGSSGQPIMHLLQ